MAEDQDNVVAVVTRGFSGLRDQIRERDDKVSSLSEKMALVELKLDQLKETTAHIQIDMAKAETVRMAMRVDALESAQSEVRAKQLDNARWIKGLIASVIVLLLGFIFNFIRIGPR